MNGTLINEFKDMIIKDKWICFDVNKVNKALFVG